MTKRELKKLAQKIAKLEKIIQENKDEESVSQAQKKINSLSKQIKSPEDIWYLDEFILEELEH